LRKGLEEKAAGKRREKNEGSAKEADQAGKSPVSEGIDRAGQTVRVDIAAIALHGDHFSEDLIGRDGRVGSGAGITPEGDLD
jgi:hypothetical protein